MSQAVNGVLYVDFFSATENPGEFTFENAVFNNQNDSTGEGAFLIDQSFVLFSPLVDPNTFMPIVGLVARFKFTSLTYIDSSTISGTVLYDQPGELVGSPNNAVYCLVSKVTPNLRLATPPIDALYFDISAGNTIAAMMNDLINIVDTAGGGSSTPAHLPVNLSVSVQGQTVFQLPYTPESPLSSMLLVNGIVYSYGADCDYTIAGDVLTWVNSLALESSDTVIFR